MSRRRRSTYTRYVRRNWFARNKVLIIIISAFIVLALAAGAFFMIRNLMQRQQESGIEYVAMKPASIPTVSMIYDNYQVNVLHGYTQEMDVHYIRRNLYLLEDTYNIPIQIDLYGNTVRAVNYRVVDAEEDNLIQNGTTEDLEKDEDILRCSIRIDNLIDDYREYVLDIILDTEKQEGIHYYVRIRRDASTALKGHIEMALNINKCIYNAGDDESKQYIADIMESRYWLADNADLSVVTLYSTLSNMTWGKMNVSMLKDPEIEILDVDGEIGYIRLNYLVSRKEGESNEYYRVSEYYRLRLTDSYAYVLNYERKADQAFDPYLEGTIGVRSAKLGVISNKSISMMCNKSGTLSCFVADNTLWAMDTDTKTLKRIFSFASGINDDRGSYRQHNIKIIDVSDDGDIQFVVYGYMNAGLHEGRAGVAMYSYDSETEEVAEKIFIPANIPYEILKNSVGSLFHYGDNNNLYIMMDQFLYRLDLGGDEAVLVASGLVENTYVIHTDSNLIAWQEDGKVNDAKKITVLNMDNDTTYTVTAAPGSCIKVLGFLNQQLVYGQGKEGDLYEEQSGRQYLLMTDMYVINSYNVIETETNAREGYFYDSINEYNRVVLKKVIRTEDGFDQSDDYTVFASELESSPELEAFSQYEEIKKTVYFVQFADSTTTAGDLAVNNNAEVMFTDENTIDIRDMLDDSGRYYVYARGEVIALETDAAKAVNMAYEQSGLVLEADGELFYRRGLIPGSVELSKVNIDLALEKIKAGDMINVTGITLMEAFYYTGARIPFVWEWDGTTYLFLGYDYSDNITMLDVDTGEEVVYTSAYVEGLIENTGHTYVVK